MAGSRPVRVLLEGRPGSGKTTIARRLIESLRDAGVEVGGFTTEELREDGGRVGFAIEDIDGSRAVLAHVKHRSEVRVGKYGVDLKALEDIALPALRAKGLLVIDELGKMELASERLRAAVTDVFDAERPVVATIHAFGHPFTDELKRRSDVEVIKVTARTRGPLPEELAARLSPKLSR